LLRENGRQVKHRVDLKANASTVRGSAFTRQAPQDEVHRSRGAFFAPEFCSIVARISEAQSGNSIKASNSIPDFVSLIRATKNEAASARPFAKALLNGGLPAKNKESGTPADAGVRCPHASGVRDAPRSKAACAALRLRARSPAGIPLAVFTNGTFVPRAQRRARLPKAMRKLRRAARIAISHSDAPRAPVLLLAGMMPEPPGNGLYLSARGCRTRSAFREYPPRWRPFNERDWRRLLSSFPASQRRWKLCR
jgi:hypothetical protein